MIRKLKLLALAAMALTAFGAIGASGAQAAQFHCGVEPCRYTLQPDGALGGKTAHHIILIKNALGEVMFATCNAISGEATTNAKTTQELTLANIKYVGCTGFEVVMNGCDYLVEANGNVNLVCEAGKEVELKVPATGCLVKIPPQERNGATFHNIGNQATKTTEITMSLNVQNITGTINEKCPIAGGAFTKGEYTTGNTLLTGESHAGVMDNAWWTA